MRTILILILLQGCAVYGTGDQIGVITPIGTFTDGEPDENDPENDRPREP